MYATQCTLSSQNYARSASARTLLLMLLTMGLAACTQQTSRITGASPPIAKIIPKDVSAHGDLRIDNYYWLRDDSRSDLDVIRHLEAEKNYANIVLAHTAGLQRQLYQEITQNLQRREKSIPHFSNGYWYYSRYDENEEYPVHMRRKGAALEANQEAEEVLLNLNQMAQGEDFFELGGYAVSPNNKHLAYAVDTTGRGLYDIKIIDLTSGEHLPELISGAEAQIVWSNDSQSIFYLAQDSETLLANRVYRHKLASPVADDQLKYQESDPTYYLWLYKTHDESTIYLFHQSISETALSILAADYPDEAFKPFYPREENHRYYVTKSREDFFVLTNWQAKDFRLMRTTAATAYDRSSWEEIVPHRPGVFLESIHALPRYLVLLERERGYPRVRIINRSTGKDYLLEFDDPVFRASFGADEETQVVTHYNSDPDSSTLKVSYSSLTTPETVYEFNLESGSRKVLKQAKVNASFDSANYKSERLFVEARDGTPVPVSLVYRKDLFNKDGSNPMYQYGYGAYGLNQPPEFWPAMLSLLDRGFVYAIAHVRGGSMMGPQWYSDGRVLNKKNTFNDFADVTRALVEQGYADAGKVFASGASAGGTLAAVMAIHEPELYKGVIIGVPFVDVVTTMLDESIPLVTNEYDEWGDPKKLAHYEYMSSYSPYDQITRRDYTNMLVTTGLYDSQVQYYEPAKFVAKLRAQKTDNNLLLFPINMTSGHGGSSGRYRAHREQAFEFAFILDLLGISQ
ncbi:MAG: S9 family peptidase [Halioglobus sp.]